MTFHFNGLDVGGFEGIKHDLAEGTIIENLLQTLNVTFEFIVEGSSLDFRRHDVRCLVRQFIHPFDGLFGETQNVSLILGELIRVLNVSRSGLGSFDLRREFRGNPQGARILSGIGSKTIPRTNLIRRLGDFPLADGLIDSVLGSYNW